MTEAVKRQQLCFRYAGKKIQNICDNKTHFITSKHKTAAKQNIAYNETVILLTYKICIIPSYI